MAKKISSSDLFEQEDIFKGIKESAIEAINKLEQLELSLKGVAKSTEPLVKNANFGTTKGIKDFTDATQKAESVAKEFLAVEKEKQALRKAQAQAEQAEIKAKRERIALEQKETALTEKQAKAIQNQTSAYKQLEANTRALKNQSKELGAELLIMSKNGQQNTAEFAKLEAQYKEVTASAQAGDAELKQLDKTIGDNFRNVGNYEGATKSLKTELRELTQALANMESSDPRFQEMANRAGELKDKMQDAKAVVQSTAGTAVENLGNSFAKMGQIGVAGVQGITAGMQLLGVENEDTLKSIAKLQALAGLADSLSVLGGLGDALTEVRAGLTSAGLKMGILTTARVADTTATGAQIIATEAEAIATTEATTSQLAFNTAILANPYVLAVAGILALVGAMVYYGMSTNKTSVEQEKLAKKQKYLAEEAKKSREAIANESGAFALLISRLKDTNAGSKERADLIKKVNETYGTTLKNISDETAFQKQLNAELKNYLSYQRAKYELQKNEEKITENLKTQDKIQEKINNAKKELPKLLKETDKWQKQLDASDGRDKNMVAFYAEKIRESKGAINAQKNNIKGLEKEFENAEKRFEDYGRKANEAGAEINIVTENGNKYVQQNEKTAKSIESVNTQFEQQNELISKQRELLQQLKEFEQTTQLDELQRQIDYQLTAEKKLISEGADAQVDALEQLVFERYKIENEFLKQREQNELDALGEQYLREKEQRKKALDDQKKELINGANGNASALKEIEKNYQTELKKLNDDEIVLYNDLQLEKKVVNENYKNEAINIKKAEGAEINRVNDEIFEAQKSYAEKSNQTTAEESKKSIDDLQKTEEQKREIVKMTSEFFVKQSEKRISAMDKEIDKAQQQYDYLKGLAESGNIDAQQSLAEQQKIINDANLRKERELKRQQRIKLAESVYSTYSQKVESGSKNPLAETIRDATLLTQFINSLPAFESGTENTGANGRGVDGRGGFHAVLHPNERVIPKTLNEQIGSMSNEDLARIAQEYQNNKNFAGNVQSGSALELAILVNEIKDLKTIIKDKPETNIELGEITSGAMEIVKKIKQGNTTTYNRYKIK